MINCEYEIWTDLGWERVEYLTQSNRIMVFNLNNRMSKFCEIKNLKTVFDKNNFRISNNNYDFMLNEKINLLDENYKKYSIKELLNNLDKKIFIDSKTFFIADMIDKLEENKKFITFDLKPNEFVLIRNVLTIYINWDCNNITENEEKKRGRPKVSIDRGSRV